MLKISNIELDYSEFIQIIGIITTSITSIVAVVISVISLRQNSKTLEEATRPCISVYINSTQFGTPIIYLIVKNFGNTSAVISNFKCDVNLSEYTYNLNAIPFKEIDGLTLAPHQKITYPLKPRNDNHKRIEKINISFNYSDSHKTYSESVNLNVSEYFNSINLRDYNKNLPFKTMSYSLQDISEKML